MNPHKRRLLINAGLLVGLAILALLLWLHPGKEDSGDVPFAVIDKAGISHIEISLPQQPPLQLQRLENTWRIAAPVAIEANAQRVQNILNILNEQDLHGYDAAGIDRSEFGLAPPQAILRFDKHVLEFGVTDPLHNQRYLLFNNKIYLLPDTHYPLLSGGVGGLADDHLLPQSREPIAFAFSDRFSEAYSLNSLSDFTVTLADKGWELKPANSQLSADDLQSWVDAWRYARAVYIEQSVPKLSGKEQLIKISFKDGSNIDYAVIEKHTSSALYRADIGLLYHLTAATLTDITAAPRIKPAAVDAQAAPDA